MANRQILELLGDKAEYLLNHQCQTIMGAVGVGATIYWGSSESHTAA